MEDVIIIDNTADAYSYQPDNGLPILTWKDDPEDFEFVKMAEVLKFLSTVHDVRPFIKSIVELAKHSNLVYPEISYSNFDVIKKKALVEEEALTSRNKTTSYLWVDPKELKISSKNSKKKNVVMEFIPDEFIVILRNDASQKRELPLPKSIYFPASAFAKNEESNYLISKDKNSIYSSKIRELSNRLFPNHKNISNDFLYKNHSLIREFPEKSNHPTNKINQIFPKEYSE